MPEPVRRGQRYMPGLDGLRALAVLAVIAYHLGFGWAQGGLLGVGIFFTLSGYLITDLLLGQWAMRGRVRLGDFWLRRARRLLPALFLMLVVVTAWVTLADPSRLPELRGEVAAAAAYVSNWYLIAEEISYFAQFGPPSPLGHLWSLAIEEQFYLVWPFMLLAGLHLIRERRHPLPVRPRLAAATLALAALSVLAMAVLYEPGIDFTRAYDGTDTRAFGLLFGAALAMVWPSRQLNREIATGARRTLDGLGLVALLVIGLLIWRTNQYSPFLYPIGLVLLSAATVLLIVPLAHPATRLAAVFGSGPMRWLGVRSYGIYLWHFPIIVLTTPGLMGAFELTSTAPVDLPRAALQVGASIVLAALSWRFVEEPIRRGALGRAWRRARTRRWRPSALSARGWAVSSAAGAVIALAALGLTGAASPGPVGSLAALPEVAPTAGSPPAAEAATDPLEPASEPATRIPISPTSPPRTSCGAVVHIGDSTSDGLVSPQYLPDRDQRIDARYARVGTEREVIRISGATSIVETLPGGTNASDVARELVASGYRGCWVLALGTNDTANVYVGSSVGLAERIDRMMAAIGDQPALWVTARTLVSGGPYAEQNMRLWNGALLDACERYPEMRVFDWAGAAREGWFIDDGIHYTSDGYAARGRLIARALAEAFPASGVPEGAGCVVTAPS